MVDFQPSAVRPLDPNILNADPANAMAAHVEPTSFLSSISSTLNSIAAAGAAHYQTRMEEEYGKLQDKFEQAGLKPHRLFMMNEDYVTFPEFQALMNNRAEIPGIDERYQAETDRQNAVHKFYDDTNQLVLKGKTQRPDLGFETLGEIHNRIMNEIATDRQSGANITGWRGRIGELLAGVVSPFTTLESDPFVPATVGTMAFGGVGPNVLTRIATLGAANAAMNVIPQIGAMDTLKQAGVPLTKEDLMWSAALGFGGGALFGGAGELFSGASGRAAMNDRYAWMTLSKREQRYSALMPEGGPRSGVNPAFWEAQLPTRPGEIGLADAAPPEPKAVIPSGVPGVIRRLEVQPPTDVIASLGGSPVGYVPRAQRGPLLVLNRVSTKAQKVRLAEDLDHVARQFLSNLAVAPQDLIPPTRPMGPSATVFPEVRAWLGPGVNDDLPQLPASWQRAAKGNTLRTEDVAREMDTETWTKSDRIGKAKREAQLELGQAIAFQQDALAGKTATFDKHIRELNEAFLRARSGVNKQAILQEIDDLTAYNDALKAKRPAGEMPKPPKSMDISTRAKRVADLQAKWDALAPDRERSIQRSEKRWGQIVASAKAWDEADRPGASDWVYEPWRYPVGHKRPKDAPKNPYEVTLLKGPTQEQIFAKAKLEFDQEKSPLAAEVTQPGDTPIKVATKVNEKHYEEVGKVDAEAFYKSSRDFMKNLEAGGPAQLLPKIGQREAVGGKPIRPGIDVPTRIKPEEATQLSGKRFTGLTSDGQVKLEDGSTVQVHLGVGVMNDPKGNPIDPATVTHFKNQWKGADWVSVKPMPSMPAGMTMQDMWSMSRFEFEPGKSLTMKEALDEIASDEEAFTHFSQCILEP